MKVYEASEAGIEAGIETFKSQKKDLLKLKEQDQSENCVDLYGSISFQGLTQKLTEVECLDECLQTENKEVKRTEWSGNIRVNEKEEYSS